MFGDTLTDIGPDRPEDRGQVGIGTLIVFIAMVLVAAIAAGVLINTAGFLQSKAQQTGEESSSQVTNQLQILSRTGVVADSSAEADTRAVVLYPVSSVAADGGDERNPLVFDNGDTVSVTVDNGDTDTELSGTSTSGVVAVANGETLEFTRDGDSITISNVDTGSSVTIGADESITVGDGDGNNGDVTFTFSTTENSDLVLGPVTEETNTGGSADLAAELFTRTESFLTVKDDASTTQSLLLNDSSTASVVSATDGSSDGIVLTGGGSDSGTLAVQTDDTLSFGVSSNKESEVTLTNERTSASITFDPTNGLETGEGGETVTLSDQVDATGNIQIEDGGESADIFTRPITDGTAITQIQLVIGRGAGSDDIDMSGTVISMRAPDGSFTLTYAPGGATEDTTFGLKSVKDDDNTLPVLSSGDRFELVIDPGKITAGETLELTITTSSGAKRVLQLRVPDSLANEEAVGL